MISWDTIWIRLFWWGFEVVSSRRTSNCWACSNSQDKDAFSSLRAVIVIRAWWYCWKLVEESCNDCCCIVKSWSSLWHSSSKSVNNLWNIPKVIWSPGGQTYCNIMLVFILFYSTCVNGMSNMTSLITLQCSFAFLKLPPSLKNSVYFWERWSSVRLLTGCCDDLGTFSWSDVIVHHRQQWRPCKCIMYIWQE